MVRFKNRYLLVDISQSGKKGAERSLNHKDILSALKDSLLTNFGDYGLAVALPRLHVRLSDAATGLCMIRCSRDSHQMVRAALTLLGVCRNVSCSQMNTYRAPVTFTVVRVAACQRSALSAILSAHATVYKSMELSEEEQQQRLAKVKEDFGGL